jgi:Endonuclease/Exonuclease/phosphatase family
MRIATWNIAHRAAWPAAAGLLGRLGVDVVLLQEAPAAAATAWTQFVMPHQAISAGRRWASAVASSTVPLESVVRARPRWADGDVPLLQTFPGSVAVAEANLGDDTPLLFVSLYGLIDHGYAYTTLHRQISDLTALLDSRLGRRVILGGDFNAGTQSTPRWRRLYDNLWERLELLGLIDLLERTRGERGPLPGCGCALGERCGHVHTVKLRSGRPVQADYLFATHEVAERLTAIRIPDGRDGEPDPFTVSDHRPIVADFELDVPFPRGTVAPARQCLSAPPPAAAVRTAAGARLPELAATADRLARVDADVHKPTITDIRLLVHVARGTLAANWGYLAGPGEFRRRSFDRALVWAAAWLALERDAVSRRHGLVRAALEHCELPSIDAGIEPYADRALRACRARLG